MQVDRKIFAKALKELGHNPDRYLGKKISLTDMAFVYGFSQESLLEAVKKNALTANYDYEKDIVWVDAIDAAHFFYCVRSAQDK